MTDSSSRGRFVWFDLITPAPETVLEFYKGVTGWGTTVWDGPMPYTMWTNAGTPLGGVMRAPSGTKMPPHWLAYISTPEVDRTVQQAVDLGARTIEPPTDIPTVGRFAILADPQGAVFAGFTPQPSQPRTEAAGPAIGEFSWHELVTHDYPAAFRFYERLFGWEKGTAMDMGEAGIYQMFSRGGAPMGGMYNAPPEAPMPPAWVHYIRIPDVHRAAETVTRLGGRVTSGPMEVPGGDWIATCTDPEGAMFAVHAKKA